MKNISKSRIYYQRACVLGQRTGCLAYGKLICFGKPNTLGCREAWDLFSGYCKKGDLEACHLGNLILFQGTYQPKTCNCKPLKAEVFRRSRALCLRRYGPACHLAAETTGEQAVAQHPGNQQVFYAKACDLGYAPSCVQVAHKLYDSTAEGKKRALKIYRASCDQKIPSACNSLGLHFAMGDEGVRDPAKGAAFFARSCLMGSSAASMEGCLHLGRLFHKGIGLTQNLEKAKVFYRKACSGGLTSGCEQLRLITAEPRPAVPPDSKP